MTNSIDTTSFGLIMLLLVLAMVHSAFQLGISVLTLMSTHVLGRGKKAVRIRPMIATYGAVSILLTFCIMLIVIFGEILLLPPRSQATVWLILALITFAVGSIVMLRYHKPGKGTRLWIAGPIVRYFINRAERARSPLQSAKLASTAIITELPLTLVIFASSALVIIELLPADYYLTAIILYSLVVMLPLSIIATMIASGHKVSTIQRWRESNKYFIQYIAAFGLYGAGLYILVFLIGYGG